MNVLLVQAPAVPVPAAVVDTPPPSALLSLSGKESGNNIFSPFKIVKRKSRPIALPNRGRVAVPYYYIFTGG